MPDIKIRVQTVDIDIEGELREYDWTRPRWTSDKLLAASPFRYDSHPSFFVNLEGEYAGTWGDSGYYDEDWASGNFVKLLAFLRQETYEEAEEYLLSTYGYPVGETLKLRLPTIRLPEPFEPLPESIVTTAYSRYLASRGISEETQAMYGIGYGRQKGFTALPWRLPDGQLANVMYRATRGKVFFYEKGGMPRRKLLYGIDVVHRVSARTVALAEAPIDALSWTEASNGEIIGIAAGGVTLSDEQADLIKRSSIEELILAGDNDKAGEKFNVEVFRKLNGHARLKQANYGVYKDMNEFLLKNGGELPEIGDKVLSFPTIRAYNKNV
ncbi:toprim domain-containing protein [Lederbergia citri]|uniref:Toprim domain-containing protein n=1 Tax=Lederbergia citri TaxID=2833580 RepID=A0A942YHF8_9BACI|nr:toprim domain-containing protein [Lederbergia citri]MBS4195380.1 toprim domain-containing protein [Lederbergia citri]